MRDDYEGRSQRIAGELEDKLREAERENRVLFEQIRLMEIEINSMKVGQEDTYPNSMRRINGSSGEYNVPTPHFNSMHHYAASEPNIHQVPQ